MHAGAGTRELCNAPAAAGAHVHSMSLLSRAALARPHLDRRLMFWTIHTDGVRILSV